MTRMAFAVALCLTTGVAALFYLGAWVLLPTAAYALRPPARFVDSAYLDSIL